MLPGMSTKLQVCLVLALLVLVATCARLKPGTAPDEPAAGYGEILYYPPDEPSDYPTFVPSGNFELIALCKLQVPRDHKFWQEWTWAESRAGGSCERIHAWRIEVSRPGHERRQIRRDGCIAGRGRMVPEDWRGIKASLADLATELGCDPERREPVLPGKVIMNYMTLHTVGYHAMTVHMLAKKTDCPIYLDREGSVIKHIEQALGRATDGQFSWTAPGIRLTGLFDHDVYVDVGGGVLFAQSVYVRKIAEKRLRPEDFEKLRHLVDAARKDQPCPR